MVSKKVAKLTSIIMISVLLAGLLSGCSMNAKAAAGRTVANASESIIDENNMESIIKELASEKYKGRKAGTPENEMAAQYIAAYFKKLGLENPTGLDNYMQFYKQPVINLKSVPTLSIIDADGKAVTEFKYVENFVLRSLSSSTEDIDLKAPLYYLNSLEDLSDSNKELKGKVVLVPWSLRGGMALYSLIDMIHSFGAAGAIGEFPVKGQYRTAVTQTVTPMIGKWLGKEYSPFINIDSDSFNKLKAAGSNGQLVHYKCSYHMDKAKNVPNVIGLLPGTDENLKNQFIIIGCHFDHVGDNLNGTYNPGALDNASGTAAMMEIARVMKQSKLQPKKSILFISFNGEEAGLLGSEYYAHHPIYPLKDSIMLQLDMVGSSAKVPLSIDTVSAIKLRKELLEDAKELGIEAEMSNIGRSDHESFINVGVPAVMFINDDEFNGYHSPDDNMEDVSKERLEQVTKLVLYYLDKNAY